MRIILHIGPHKTGSTYIQQMFCAHRDRLRAEGVLYPDNDWFTLSGHHRLIDGNRIGDYRSEVNRLIGDHPGAQRIVFSSENFARLSPEQVEQLRDQSDYPTEICYFLRRPERVLYSSWQETIRLGRRDSLLRFIMREISRPPASRIVNPEIVLGAWSARFGISCLKIFDYDHLQESNRNIFTALCETTTGASIEDAGETKVNTSIPLETLEVFRCLHALEGSAIAKKKRASNRFLRSRSKTKSFLTDTVRDYLTDLDMNAIAALHRLRESAVKKYRESLVGGHVENITFGTLQIPDETWLLRDGVREALAALHRELYGPLQGEAA